MVQMAALALLTASALLAQAGAQTPAGTGQTANAAQNQVNAGQTSARAGQDANRTDPWAAVRFLIGSWEAKTTGGVAQAQSSAGYSFRLELREHVLARHTRNGSCTAPEDFDCQHSDLLYLYPESGGQQLKAIYFDNEGHVIHYDVSTPKAGTVVFLSDAAQAGPQYRLTYTLLDGVMCGQFEIKMPGQAEFTSYLEWSGHQR
jgi:hypothetical protein